MISIVETTQDHIDAMHGKMRADDVREVVDFSRGSDPYQVLQYSFERSTMCYTCLADDDVAAVFGVAPYSLTGLVGRSWMLSTDALERYPTGAARYSRRAVRYFMEKYRRLENYVDGRYTKCVRWLEWMGFTVEEDPTMVNGAPFRFFFKERE